MSAHVPFLSGMIAAGYLVAGLFFLRFWRRTGDGLFAAFAAAFWLFALNQAAVAFLGLGDENRGWIYLLRLAAFVLIIIGIVYKNRDE